MPEPGVPAVGAVAIWGSSDLAGLGDQLLARVVEQELLARLPGWRMSLLAPFGWERRGVADGGLVAEPLGPRSDARAAGIAQGATLSVTCPGFPLGIGGRALARRYGDERAAAVEPFFSAGLGEQLEASHPVLLCGVRVTEDVPASLVEFASRSAHVSVRDAVSLRRLREAGLRRDAAVVAHPGLLLRRVVDFETLPVRRRQLRQLGVLPAEGGYAVLALGEGAAPDAGALDGGLDAVLADVLAESDADALVVLPVGGAGADADARGRPSARLRARGTPTSHEVCTVPDDLVLEDRLAVLAGAQVVIATGEHGAAAAAGLGAPWVLLDPHGEHRAVVFELTRGDQDRQVVDSLDELAVAVRLARKLPAHSDTAAAALAAHFDVIAELAWQALCDAGADPHRSVAALAAENAALRHAHWRQRQRIVVERQHLADSLAGALLERDSATTELVGVRAEHEDLSRRVTELSARVAEYERELTAWQHTKLVRWTKPLRQAYARRLSR